MKYYKMIIVYLFLVLNLSYKIFGTSKIDFSISPYFRFSYGEITELNLYYKDTSKIASELIWDEKPLFSIGVNFDLKLNNFNFFLDGNYSLPIQSGKMYDSDYFLDGTKFIYSIHEEKAVSNFFIMTGCSYSFNLKNNISISPVLFFDYTYNSFEARNGYGWYGDSQWSSDGNNHSWDSEYAHYFPDGKYRLAGIDFFQYNCNAFIGVGFNYNFLSKFSINLTPSFAFFTYNYFSDHHLSKVSDYTVSGFQYDFFKTFQIFTDFTFFINKSNLLYLNFIWNYISQLKGMRYYEGEETSNKSGFKMWNVNFSLGYTFVFHK